MKIRLPHIDNKTNKITAPLLLIAYGFSCFFGNFFTLRIDSYVMPYIMLQYVGVLTPTGGGVYFYMIFSGFIYAAFSILLMLAVVSLAAYFNGFKADKRTAVLYFIFFAAVANVILGFFSLLTVRYTYGLYGFQEIARFAVLTAAYGLFSYFFVRDTVAKNKAPRYYLNLAATYLGASILSLIYGLVTGGAA